MSDTVQTRRDGPVTVVTIDRPKALNALDEHVLRAFHEAVEEAATNGTRALVVTGAGEKAFVAGADISAMASMDATTAHGFARAGHGILEALRRGPFVSIAAVNGFALGGGMELALGCDVRIAAENAVFGLPEVTLGVIPGFGGTQKLARLVGPGLALELVTTGRKLKAAEALELGVVNRVVDVGASLDAAVEMGNTIAKNGPVAVALARDAVHTGLDSGLDAGLALEAAHFGACFATADQKEGMQAFLEKRKASFKGQ